MLDGNHRDFYHEVFAAGPAPESPEVREYVAFRVRNTVDIAHELGARYSVYWPGSLGYFSYSQKDCLEIIEQIGVAVESVRLCRKQRSVTWACKPVQTASPPTL